ncbi:MAG: hypothetical protein ACUVQQ_13620 [Thermogutta sp.]
MARQPMILPVVVIPAICILANIFLYPQVREGVRRYIATDHPRNTATPLSDTSPLSKADGLVATSTSAPETDADVSRDRASQPKLHPAPTIQAMPPQTFLSHVPPHEGIDLPTETDADLAKAKESAEPPGVAGPPPASLRGSTADLDPARVILSSEHAISPARQEAAAGAESKESRQTTAEIARIPPKDGGEKRPDAVASPADGGFPSASSIPAPAVPAPGAGPAKESARESQSDDGKELQFAYDSDGGSAGKGEGEVHDEDGPVGPKAEDFPPLEAIRWPKRNGDGAKATISPTPESGVPTSRWEEPQGFSVPESRRVRRLPPADRAGRDASERLRSAAEAVEPIPVYPDTGYPALFP